MIDDRFREEQAGFRKGRSCCEQIFTLRNIIEQCVEFQKPLHITFIDFKKASDSIHRESIWKIARLYGIPEKFIKIFKNIYLNSTCCIKTVEGFTDYFPIETGVRQGCILSPFLFILVLDFIMRKSTIGSNLGIKWQMNSYLSDLNFADDIALLEESFTKQQELTTNLEQYANKVGLRVSVEKTKAMKVRKDANTNHITVNDQPIDNVKQFKYLGSIITDDGDVEIDVRSRIGQATSVFKRMDKVWKSSKISLKIKIQLCYSIVLSTAIYACETWKTSSKINQKLNTFHQRCLRKIMKITYLDRVTNEEVLARSGCRKLTEIITERRMKMAGHILRRPDTRHSKYVLSWNIEGKRKKGRPKRTWRKTFQEDLERVNISINDAENTARDRQRWRQLAAQCAMSHRRN